MSDRVLNAWRLAPGGVARRRMAGVSALALAAMIVLAAPIARAEIATTGNVAVDELLRRIDERDRAIAARDAAIDDLTKRVQALEQQVNVLRSAKASAVSTAQNNREAVIVDLLRRVEMLEQQRARGFPVRDASAGGKGAPPSPGLIDAVQKIAWPSGPGRRSTVTAADDAAVDPGAVTVDEAAAERALERSLTQAGALLLEPGQIEIEPSFQYLHRDQDGPLLVAVAADTVVTTTRLRSHEFEGGVDLRVGLPWDSQFEIGVPIRHASLSAVSASASSSSTFGFVENETDATGFGDVRIGLAATLVREEGWRPDILARIEWDTDSGQEESGVPLGTGFDEITGSIVLLKRQDPLAFVGQFAYRAALEDDGINPGDELIFSLGANLAASPATSLSLTLDQSFIGEVEVNGQAIPGSDQVVTTLTFGVSTVVERGVLVTLEGGVGLSEDAPDYFVGLSVPISFDLTSR